MILKNIAISILLFLFASCCSCTKEATARSGAQMERASDCEALGLEGRISKWTRSSFRHAGTPGGRIEKQLLKSESYAFNSDCMKTGIEVIDENNALVSESSYTYDPGGRITEEIHGSSNGEPLSRTRYEYDARGGKDREITEDLKAGIVYASEWKHDPEKSLTRYTRKMITGGLEILLTETLTRTGKNGSPAEDTLTEYRTDGSVIFKRHAMYRPDGSPASLEEFSGSGVRLQEIKHTYDCMGNLVKKSEALVNHSTGKTEIFESVYLYDNTGRLIESREPGSRKTIAYDGKGNEKQTIVYSDTGAIIEKTTKAYYESGLKSEELVENSDGRPGILYGYGYDAKGNHVETKCFRLDQDGIKNLVMSYEYEIVYYE